MSNIVINDYKLYSNDTMIVYNFMFEGLEGKYKKKQLIDGTYLRKLKYADKEAFWGDAIKEEQIYSSFNKDLDSYFIENFEREFHENVPTKIF